MSDIYNLDNCIEESLQMNFYIVGKLSIVQNVLYVITYLRQLIMHFLNVRKYIIVATDWGLVRNGTKK